MSLVIPNIFSQKTGSIQLQLLDDNFTYVVSAIQSTIDSLNLGTIAGVISPSQLSTGHPYWDTSSNFWIGSGLTSSTTGTAQLNVGVLGGNYTGAINPLAIFASDVAGYNQLVTQNKSSNAAASNDIIVSNNLSSDTKYYGDLGINSSNYSGTGSFSLPNAVYLMAYGNDAAAGTATDLVLGTNSGNASATAGSIRLVINGGATDAVTINPLKAVAFNGSYGNSGNILQSTGNGSPPSWTSSGPKGIDVFYPCYFTGTATAGTLTTSSVTQGYLQAGASTFTVAGSAGTATVSQTGTVATISGSTSTTFAGAVISYGLSATATFGNQASPQRDGTTMNVTAVSSGAVQAGKIINTNATFTASKATTVMSVTAVTVGGIHVGMSTIAIGSVNAYLTNSATATSGTSGTSQITLTTVTANHIFGVGQVLTATAAIQAGTYITSLASGTGGSGTVINLSLPLVNTVSGTVTSTSNGGVGRYTMSASGTVASGTVTATGTQLIGGATVTYQICATVAENGTATLTAPAGTTFTSVDFASYGTPTGTCGSFAIGGCHASNSVSVVQGYLIGQSGTINIPATNGVFGDPCSGIAKSLYIQATATQPATGGGGTGVGGTGTYVSQSTFFTPQPMPITANTNATVTVTSLGTGVGGNGTYNVTPSLTAASGTASISAAGTGSVSITAGSGSSWTISPALTFSSQSLISNTYNWTVPSGVNAVKYHVAGAGGGGAGGGGGLSNITYGINQNGSNGGSGGYGGRSAGIYTGLTPGNVIAVRVANKGLGGAGGVGNLVNAAGNYSNYVGFAGTAGNGNTTLGAYIYATSGTAGSPGQQVIFTAGSTTQFPNTGTSGSTGSGVGGTFNGSTGIIFWFSNGIGYPGSQGAGGGSSANSKSSTASANNGSTGGDGIDGIVVIEY